MTGVILASVGGIVLMIGFVGVPAERPWLGCALVVIGSAMVAAAAFLL